MSYSSDMGWSRRLGKKHSTAKKKAAKQLLGWGGKGGLTGSEGFTPMQGTGSPCPSPQPQARVVGDKSELKCCRECVCDVEFRWESNEKHEKNILVPLINWFLYYI